MGGKLIVGVGNIISYTLFDLYNLIYIDIFDIVVGKLIVGGGNII